MKSDETIALLNQRITDLETRVTALERDKEQPTVLDSVVDTAGQRLDGVRKGLGSLLSKASKAVSGNE